MRARIDLDAQSFITALTAPTLSIARCSPVNPYMVSSRDEEVAAAMRMMFKCTHDVCEGAAAAALAAATQEASRIAGRKIAVVASGGNVDQSVFADILKTG